MSLFRKYVRLDEHPTISVATFEHSTEVALVVTLYTYDF
jgi:hypothetical protein